MRWLRDDRGYTLAELLVVMALMVIVLTVAYAVFDVTSTGTKASDRESFIAHEIGAPLGSAERLLMQNSRLYNGWVAELNRTVTPTDYLISFTTDQDSDNSWEMHIIEVTADGRLVMTSREESDSPTPRVSVWSDHNFNQPRPSIVQTGTPLFTYYDANDIKITEEINYFTARRVTVTIVTEYDGKRFSDSRDVLFRNR